MLFYIVNVPPTHSLDSLHKLIVENGGTFSMNLNSSVTHSVAADSKGIKYEAAKRHGDVIHYSWVLECCSQKKLLPLKPKHFLSLSGHSKKKLEEEIDEFSDSYFWDLELVDLKQLLSNVSRSEDVKAIDYYRGKYCPKHEWCIFAGCQIYFLPLRPTLKSDWDALLELAIRRLKVEVSFRGGKVSDNHVSATHIVVFCTPGTPVGYETVLKSCNEAEKHVMAKGKIHIVAHQWLEDSLERAQRLQEDAYSLNPNTTKSIEKSNCDRDSEKPLASEHIESQHISSPSKEYKDRGRNKATSGQHMLSVESGGKKRGRPAARSMQKGKSGVEQVRRARPRTTKKGPAKISEVESDSSDHTIEKSNAETGNIDRQCNKNSKVNDFKMVEHERSDEKKRGRPPVSNTQKGKAGFEQVRRTRARIAKGTAKIGDIESDNSDSTNEKTNVAEETGMKKGMIGTLCEENSKADEFKMLEDRDSKQKGKAIEQIENVHEFGKSEKLEVMLDPIQAMLLDMVPSLGMSETKIEEKQKQPIIHNNSEAAAKKKVSFKDVASELLKDW